MTGFDAMKPKDFANTEPKLVLEEYFLGRTLAWGIFEDRFGSLRRQFVVDIEGTWDGETLTLDEHFDYADGETDRRVWRIRRLDNHTYEGRADDIIGTAGGQAYGNALNWAYDLDLKMGERSLKVHFNDWMWLQPGGVLVNRATMSKWGITLGTVTLFFRKAEADEPMPRSGESRLGQ
nr:DUF3833 domain-containing protein [Roseospira visakhapatnamensis]